MKDQNQAIDERYPGLFQPDLLLPSQFHERFRRQRRLDGERRLMLAGLNHESTRFCVGSDSRKGTGRWALNHSSNSSSCLLW